MGNGGSSLAEAVPELAANDGQMAHPAGAGCLPPAGLHAPVVLPDTSPGVAARGTHLKYKDRDH